MANTPDIARVVSLIMENPRLIEEISSMVNKSEGEESESVDTLKVSEKTGTSENEASASAKEEKSAPSRQNRSELLLALKPYVSKQRAQAIDSMITIVNILDTMKGR